MYVYLHICTSLATKYFRWIEQHNDHRSKKELWLKVQQFVSKCSKNLNMCINILKVQPHNFEFKCSIMNPCINIFYILIGGMKQLYFFICQLLRLHYFEEEEKSYLSKHGQWWHSKRGYIDIERALPGSFWKKCLTLEVIWRIGSSGSGSTLMGVSCTFVWLSLNGCCQKLCDDQKRFWGVKTEGSMLMRKVVSLWYGSWIEVRQRW